MYIGAPRIGAVCSADPNDSHALAGGSSPTNCASSSIPTAEASEATPH